MAILVLETGMIYPSISAAARATGVDPSNAGKVLRGQRKSAGGYSFKTVTGTAAPTQREISRALRKQQRNMTESQQQRRAAQREKSQQRVKAQQQIAKQQRQTQQRTAAGKSRAPRDQAAAEQRERIRTAHAALVEANDMIRQAKRGGTGAMARKDLEALAQQMGASKQGLFKTDKASISEYSEEDLQQLLQRIAKIKEQEAERRKGYESNYAQQYGLKSMQEAKEKHDALDALSRAYAKLRETANRASGRFAYSTLYETMSNEIAQLSADQIMDLADRLDTWLSEKRDHDQDELDQIYAKWQADMAGTGGDEDDTDEDMPTTIRYS